MTLTFDGLVVFVADVPSAARVYEEALGLVRDWSDDNHVQFQLPTKDNPQGAWLLLHPVTGQSSPQHLGTFSVDDVDAVVARLQDAGFTVTQQPEDQPWGVREASVTDPDGNGLTLTTPSGQQPGSD